MGFIFQRPLRDKIILPAVAGILGTLAIYPGGIAVYYLGLSKLVYIHFVAELFITPQLTRTLPGLIFGFVTGLIVGAALAVGFKLLLEWTGSDWLWLKAVGYAAVMWLLWVGMARNLFGTSKYTDTDIISNIVLLNQSILYILATTYFMQKLAGGRKALENRK